MLRQAGTRLSLDTVFVSHLAGVLKSMVAEGRGMAWLPTSHIAEDLETGRLVRAGPEAWDLDVAITLFRSHDKLPAPAEAFWKAAQRAASML
jgi:DNA-binding transcriptional LysR family regulator